MENLPDQLNPSERQNLVKHAARSVKWTTLGSFLPRLISPISTMVLAGLLTPSDFGTVAVSTLVIALAQIIVGLGLGQAVVQRRNMISEAASFAFWLSLSLAGVLYGALWIFAPQLALFYQNPIVTNVIRVSGISLVLYALGSIPSALLTRELKFYSLFWVNSLPPVTTVIVSLALAFSGMGVWALVLGPLAGVVVGTISAWMFSRWRPTFSSNRSVVRPLLSFSTWVVISSFLSWLFLYGDNAIAGYFLGIKGLGIYSLGFNISSLLPGMITAPLSAIAYPAFCSLQGNRKEIGHDLLQLQSITAAILFPVCFGLAAIAIPAVTLFYGDKWPGLGSVIQVLAIVFGLSTLWSLNSDAYRAIGRPDIWVKLSGVTLFILVPTLLFSAPHGLIIFTIARSFGQFIYILLNIVIVEHVLGYSIKDQLRRLAPPSSCVAVMYIVAYLLVRKLMPFEGGIGWLKLFFVIIISASTYLLLLWGISRDLWNRIVHSGSQVFSRT